MTITETKKIILEKVNSIDDQSLLSKILSLLEKKEKKVYQLSEFQLEQINEAKDQYQKGEFISQEEIDEKVKKWSKK